MFGPTLVTAVKANLVVEYAASVFTFQTGGAWERGYLKLLAVILKDMLSLAADGF